MVGRINLGYKMAIGRSVGGVKRRLQGVESNKLGTRTYVSSGSYTPCLRESAGLYPVSDTGKIAGSWKLPGCTDAGSGPGQHVDATWAGVSTPAKGKPPRSLEVGGSDHRAASQKLSSSPPGSEASTADTVQRLFAGFLAAAR